jgi:hypothetical protein
MYYMRCCLFLWLFLTTLTGNTSSLASPATFPVIPSHFNGSEAKFRQWLQTQKSDVPLGIESVFAEAESSLFAVYVSNGSGIIGADLYLFSCDKARCDQLLFVDRMVTRGHGANGRLIISFSKEKKEIVVKEDDGFVHLSRRFRK